MKIEYMKELLAIEKYGTYSLAAQKLYITQSALSRHINNMEQELNIILVERDTHKTALTEAGKETCKSFQKILHEYSVLTDKLTIQKSGMNGTLRLGMLYYTISSDFKNILPRFCSEYPNVCLKRFSYQPQEIYNALLNDSLDIGVLAKAEYPTEDLLCFHDFACSSGIVMVAKDHPLSLKESLTLNELKNEPIILLSEDPCTSRSITEALSRCNFTPKSIIYTDQIDSVPFSILSSGGVHINGSGLVFPGYEDTIKVIPIVDAQMSFTKSFVYRKSNDNPIIPLFLNIASSK
ncbi:MAG: LysR family transcriptional regulator [Lachnospiraceae bacterium]|nr:LysR family transcriptional regulator [Lachnospiraceae bacterium]MDD3616719.1 LysR family transcriptional regulator [Lachnospiraceae bacterium]